MKINRITSNQTTFYGQSERNKPDFLEKFYDNAKNSADMTDAILCTTYNFQRILRLHERNSIANT